MMASWARWVNNGQAAAAVIERQHLAGCFRILRQRSGERVEIGGAARQTRKANHRQAVWNVPAVAADMQLQPVLSRDKEAPGTAVATVPRRRKKVVVPLILHRGDCLAEAPSWHQPVVRMGICSNRNPSVCTRSSSGSDPAATR